MTCSETDVGMLSFRFENIKEIYASEHNQKNFFLLPGNNFIETVIINSNIQKVQ
jgi:hypothetical protein